MHTAARLQAEACERERAQTREYVVAIYNLCLTDFWRNLWADKNQCWLCVDGCAYTRSVPRSLACLLRLYGLGHQCTVSYSPISIFLWVSPEPALTAWNLDVTTATS